MIITILCSTLKDKVKCYNIYQMALIIKYYLLEIFQFSESYIWKILLIKGLIKKIYL